MASFAKAGFNAVSYAAFRPSYPPTIFKQVLAYHKSPSNLLLDLGCGHGLISRALSPSFTRVIATDPSASMIEQATRSTPKSEHPNIVFQQASAEHLSWLKDGEVDCVVAGQAAHWFDYSKVWPELARTVRKGGTVAFWGYKDNLFVDYPEASKVLDHYCYGPDTMGPYWESGREILRRLYRDIVPPETEWEDVTRAEYEPGTQGKESGKGEVVMRSRMKLGEMEGYARTFSTFNNWAAAHQDRKARQDGGEGDIIDEMFDKMLEVEPEWKAQGENWKDFEVENEWGSVILLARRK